MDRVKDFITACKALAKLSDAELAELEAEGLAVFDAVKAGDLDDIAEGKTLDMLRQVAAKVADVQAIAAERIDAANVQADEIAAIEADMERPAVMNVPDTAEDVEDADQTDDAKDASESDQAGPATSETVDESDSGDADDAKVDEPEPVTAAARPDLAAFRPPASTRPAEQSDSRPTPYMLGPGSEVVTDHRRADELLMAAHESMGPAAGGQVMRIPVLTRKLDWSGHESQVLRSGDAVGNRDRVEALVADATERSSWVDDSGDPLALTAAGQFCATPEPFYEQPILGEVSRPYRDSLPQMGLTRGQIDVSPGPVLSDILVDQADAAITTLDPCSATGPKTIQDFVTCPTPVQTCLEATSVRLRFDNFGEMTWRERQDAFTRIAQVQAARHREQQLLAKLDALSTVVTQAITLGAYRDVLVNLEAILTQERSRLRVGADFRFRVVLGEDLWSMMKGDVTRQLPGDGQGGPATLTDADLAAAFSAIGANVVRVMDRNVYPAQGAGPLELYTAVQRINIYPEGTVMFGGGQTISLGIVRDSVNNDNNQFETFDEQFETLFRVGGWPMYALDLSLCLNGSTGAAITVACPTIP